VSHQPERKEKNCLNCGTEVHGRFCHVCGQENVITHQNFWALVKHFIFDIFHFDGKFFHTLGYLFSRPGFVARQYVDGKRMSYLDPIRMYLFTSAVFFLVFFSINTIKVSDNSISGNLSMKDRQELMEEYQDRLKSNPSDSVLLRRMRILRDTTKPVDTSSPEWQEQVITFGNRTYTSVKNYDSLQAALPAAERDGWIKRSLIRQSIKVNTKYEKKNELLNVFVETFLHKLPYLLFFSLPFFALILKLLYSRRQKLYYSDHAVFTLYHYIFSFILMLVIIGVAALRASTGWGILRVLFILLLLSWPVYLFLEMKNFYQQRLGKTLGKFLLLNLAGVIILLLLFIVFLLFSIFQL